MVCVKGQHGLVTRLMVDGWMSAWEIVKVTYDDPKTAPTSVGSAVSRALLVLGAIAKAAEHPGPSVTRVPDQQVADMMTV